MTQNQMTFPVPQLDAIMLRGGLDMVTPTLSLSAGAARQALNFECNVTGGYSRIPGYERVDGHISPTAAANAGTHAYIGFVFFVNLPTVGQVVTASGGATGVVARINGNVMVITKITGTWAVSETVVQGALSIGTIWSIVAGPVDPQDDAISRAAVADIYRSAISAPPGSGPVRGVVEFNDVVYAFRDDITSINLDIYKTTTSGWVKVPYNKSVLFTAGGTGIPNDGDTLTQGAVTATILRVVRQSESWQSGNASGQFVITTPAGGNFAAGAATAGTVAIALSGAETSQSLLAGGKFSFEEHNFGGQANTNRIYGCDGVNPLFEFDGTVLVKIPTGATGDTPLKVLEHKGYLFAIIKGSAIHSAPGLPYDFTALSGAYEIATGADITDAISMPGAQSTGTLALFNRGNTNILYGNSPSDWNLTPYNNGTGSLPFSAQNMAATFVFDDRGVNSVQTSLQFGNFTQSTITNAVLPFINDKINKMVASTLCRRKSQYRLFFNDGYGLVITVVNNKLLGCMPIYFPDAVTCIYEGKTSTGVDVIYFGSDNGMVYQMEIGTSFDGVAMDFYLITNYSNSKSPRTLKTYRKALPEISSEQGAYVAFDFSYVLGYNSSEYNQPVQSTYSAYTGQIQWDQFIWDNFFWDSNRVEPLEIDLDGTAENISIVINGSSNYIPAFSLNSILVHYSPRRMMR